MPQLDIVTYVGQIFWLLLAFITLYLLVVSYVLPSLAFIIKVRKKKIITIGHLLHIFQKEKSEISKKYDIILSKSTLISSNLLSKSKIKSNSWVNKTIKNIFIAKVNVNYFNNIAKLNAKKIILISFVK